MELKLLTDEEILVVIKSQRDKFDVDEFVLINVETIKPFIQAQLDKDVENIIPKLIEQANREIITIVKDWLSYSGDNIETFCRIYPDYIRRMGLIEYLKQKYLGEE